MRVEQSRKISGLKLQVLEDEDTGLWYVSMADGLIMWQFAFQVSALVHYGDILNALVGRYQPL